MSHLIPINPLRVKEGKVSLSVREVVVSRSEGEVTRDGTMVGSALSVRLIVREHEAVYIEAVSGYHHPLVERGGELQISEWDGGGGT